MNYSLKFVCPTWGMDTGNPPAVISRIREAGYDGVEIGFPFRDYENQIKILQLAKAENMIVIAQHYDAEGETFSSYRAAYTNHIRLLSSLKPDFINSQTGKDYFTTEGNLSIIQEAIAVAKETGIKIVHETHRGKFSYSLPLMQEYFDHLPDLRITADFSHYCVVSESFLQNPVQKKLIASCIERSDHIHARIGHTQGPQVNDPRAKEWEEALRFHLEWWDAIIAARKNEATITITPEFGPAPYMPAHPHTCEPMADQWQVNLYMKELLRKRWKIAD